jgi:hypothetical protein
MHYLTEAIAAIRRTEQALRELAKGAVADGDYEAVQEITKLAKELSALVPVQERAAQKLEPDSARVSSVAERSAVSRENPSDNAYPKFERHSKRLVKLGWSARDERIYEHRASYDVVEEICRRFVEKAGSKKVLRVERILPFKRADGDEVPSYQVYLVLKWLQQCGIVERQGKDGYLFKDPEFSLKDIWESTPAKQ